MINATALRFTESFQLQLLDQTLLPNREEWLTIQSLEQMQEAIQSLRVRGAPLIGLSATLFLAQLAMNNTSTDELFRAYQLLRQARPTAINLMNNLDVVWAAYLKNPTNTTLLKAAKSLWDEDVQLCLQMSEQALPHLPVSAEVANLITHCNTGALATAGGGTALGAIIHAQNQGRKLHVFVCETRPLGQGARLTYWELQQAKVPCTLITDSMVGYVMQTQKIHSVWVGADRITRNGDVANKIGTYQLACLAKIHNIPFFVVAPRTTFDPSLESGADIHIEQRPETEITDFWKITAHNTQALNPGFDVTPGGLITRIITNE